MKGSHIIIGAIGVLGVGVLVAGLVKSDPPWPKPPTKTPPPPTPDPPSTPKGSGAAELDTAATHRAAVDLLISVGGCGLVITANAPIGKGQEYYQLVKEAVHAANRGADAYPVIYVFGSQAEGRSVTYGRIQIDYRTLGATVAHGEAYPEITHLVSLIRGAYEELDLYCG